MSLTSVVDVPTARLLCTELPTDSWRVARMSDNAYMCARLARAVVNAGSGRLSDEQIFEALGRSDPRDPAVLALCERTRCMGTELKDRERDRAPVRLHPSPVEVKRVKLLGLLDTIGSKADLITASSAWRFFERQFNNCYGLYRNTKLTGSDCSWRVLMFLAYASRVEIAESSSDCANAMEMIAHGRLSFSFLFRADPTQYSASRLQRFCDHVTDAAIVALASVLVRINKDVSLSDDEYRFCARHSAQKYMKTHLRNLRERCLRELDRRHAL